MSIHKLIALVAELEQSGYTRLQLRGVIVRHLTGNVTNKAIEAVLDAAVVRSGAAYDLPAGHLYSFEQSARAA